ncbi:MAG: cohesin domain-containing protein, partial [Methanosarcinales archaeon]
STLLVFAILVVSPITMASGQVVSVKNYSADTGAIIDVTIDVDRAYNISGIAITLNYDPRVLTATKVSSGDLTSGSSIYSNIANPGEVAIGIIDVTGFSGNGSIAKITFEVIGNGGDTSPLNLSNVSATDTSLKEVTLTTQNGKITGVCCGICGVTGDINDDSKITSLDALMALQMSVGLIQVDQCADVNGDGIVTSVDALMILKASVGLITL